MSLGVLGVYVHFFKGYQWVSAFLVAGCVGVALVLAMVISSLVGTLVPLFFNKIKIDPAVASGPLITTINDLVAVVTYYGLAWLLLIEILKSYNLCEIVISTVTLTVEYLLMWQFFLLCS